MESVRAYYSEFFPGVVHAAEMVDEAAWIPPPPQPPTVVPAQVEAGIEAEARPQPQPQPAVGVKGVCAVCFRPTTFRCKQCKAVNSFKCQIAHWRQGHKNECHPPSADAKHDDEAEVSVSKERKMEQRSASEENIVFGAEAIAKTNTAVHSKTKAAGPDNIGASKTVPSVLTVDKVSHIPGVRSVTPNSSKGIDNISERNSKPSDKAISTANNLATSLKKIVKQQTVPKVVRHYPSEATHFPYELFIKLYEKVELQPFGLHNLGNSCYANAVLQCLIQGKTALSPTGILSHLPDIGSSFGPGKQEDAHEFLRYAIDAMQSVCMKEARKSGAHRLHEETTLMQLIFGGYLRSKIKCTKCDAVSEQCERMLDLTVEIDGDISSLEGALERFTSTEVLDGDNKYQCSRCKSHERAKKKLTISEAPNVLTIALKRYQSGKFGKINKAIRFPETLNLKRYMSSKSDDTSPVYSLYAVVVHQDVMNAAFSGHYVCYVKDTHGKWYKTDDSQVKPTSLENVTSKCAYMLLYARCSPRAPSSARPLLMAQDPAHVKKAKAKVNSGRWHVGPMSRHPDSQLNSDHMTDDLPHAYDEFGMPYSPAESPSPSESSSIFTNSDAGSHSTDSSDSTRNSTSEEYEHYFFGQTERVSYPDYSMVGNGDNGHITYSRSKSGLGTSSSGQEVDRYRNDDHRLQGTTEGWLQGDESSSLYTNQSKHHFSSKLTEQYRRRLDGTEHDPGEARSSVLLRRSGRERTAQTFY
uniref:USP domain-containing protein n=1 Tax=Leersia perrieri TaxID=77586 RepID=A0A0D9X8Y2_9ORYZ